MSHFEPLRPNRSLNDLPEQYEFAHGKDSICVYDINTMEFIKEIPVGRHPDCHATTADNRYLYLATWDGTCVLDQNTLEICKIVETGPVYATNALADGNTMLIHDEHGGIYILKDVEDMDKVHIHKYIQPLSEEAANQSRVELGGKGHFLHGGRYYLCAGWVSGKTFLIDLENDYAFHLFMPHCDELERGDDLIISADKTKAFVACHRNDDQSYVNVIDLTNRCVKTCIPTGRGTCGLTMTGDEQYVIASNDRDDSISVICVDQEKVVNTLSAKAGFRALGFTDDIRIQGITASRSDSIFVYECSGTGALVRFDDILGKGDYIISWKGCIYDSRKGIVHDSRKDGSCGSRKG